VRFPPSRSTAVSAIADGERMMNALRAYFEGMRRVEAPKSLVLVTEGFILDPQRPSFIELERPVRFARGARGAELSRAHHQSVVRETVGRTSSGRPLRSALRDRCRA
jgi:hypothetical protein